MRTWVRRACAAALGIGCVATTTAAAADDDPFAYADQFLAGEVGANRVPAEGDVRVLVIPVSFGGPYDLLGFLDFFDPDPDAAYTFSNFWRDQSGGRLDIEPLVADPVVFDGCPIASVPDCAFDIQTIDKAIPIFEQAFDEVLGEQGFDLAEIDRTGPDGVPDGWTDGVVFVWPPWGRAIAPPVYPFLEIVEDGVQVGNVAITGLDRETALHEFGHSLGAADQYLWDQRHSLMSWCFDCSLDTHSRAALGWAEVVSVGPGEAQVLTLAPAHEGGRILRLGASPEYFLVEYRTEHYVGDHRVDPGRRGVLVTHADESVGAPVFGQANYPAWHPLLQVERASEGASGDWLGVGAALLPAADHNPPSGTYNPADTNWYDGTRSGVSVRVLEEVPRCPGDEDGPPYLRVEVRGPTPFGEEPSPVEGPLRPVPCGGEPGPDPTGEPDAAAEDALGPSAVAEGPADVAADDAAGTPDHTATAEVVEDGAGGSDGMTAEPSPSEEEGSGGCAGAGGPPGWSLALFVALLLLRGVWGGRRVYAERIR